MPQQAPRRVGAHAIDLRPPTSAVVADQWYLIDTPDGGQAYVRGEELITLPTPVLIRAIAWRV